MAANGYCCCTDTVCPSSIRPLWELERRSLRANARDDRDVPAPTTLAAQHTESCRSTSAVAMSCVAVCECMLCARVCMIMRPVRAGRTHRLMFIIAQSLHSVAIATLLHRQC